MFYVDSHIHLQDCKTKDAESIVKNAQKFNVTIFVNPSAHPTDWPAITSLAAQYPQIIPAYGIHPWHIQAAAENWADDLASLLQNNPRAWVGECGIDRLKNPDTEAQLAIFKTHIELAKQYNRALIIHAVKADSILEPLLAELPARTVFHSFTGSVEWGQQIQRRGFCIGLNFSILRKKNAAQIINSLNLSRVLLETDGPYQSGEKGVETMPQNLPLLAEKIAELRGLETARLAEILYQNWRHFTGEI
jgi:TatD DNase family protein